MSQQDAFFEAFQAPPREYRTMPLWVWNGDMSEARITEMLEQFKAQGMGGVFVHPRPGLITPYLSERWFELWGFALRECERLDLECNVYDENSYPAGFAGGHVPSKFPETMLQYVHPTLYEGGIGRLEGELLGAYRVEGNKAEPLPPGTNLHEAAQQGTVLTVELKKMSGQAWMAGFPYIDQSKRETADAFLEVTYEPYKAHFKEAFGKTIQKFFIDEPHLGWPMFPYGQGGFPLTRYIAREFQVEHGYSIFEKLPDLFVNQEGCEATRFDYYSTLQRLWTFNFIKPIYDWCEENGVSFTGHAFEHEWPVPFNCPNVIDFNRYLHIPGIDLLAFQVQFDQQYKEGHILLTVRELNSVANQLDRKRRFCEVHGVAGHQLTFERNKRLTDWLLVHGVNFVDEHLAFQTISGARKYDHPATFTDHSPWWEDYRWLNDHVARLTWAVSQGVQRNRVLVLHPTTTGWVHANPVQRPHDINPQGGLYGPAMTSLRATQSELVLALCNHQIDFDLGDEWMLRDHGALDDEGLCVGAARYYMVVVPKGMENWCETTLTLMEQYIGQGGLVLAMGEAPRLVNGRPDPRPAALAEKAGKQWSRVEDAESLCTALRRLLAPIRVQTKDGGPLPEGVYHMQRDLPNGEFLHIFVNSGFDHVREEIKLNSRSVTEFDTFTGEVFYKADSLLDLPPAGSAIWLVQEGGPVAIQMAPEATAPVTELTLGDFERAEAKGPNMLSLDYCDLHLAPAAGGQSQTDINMAQANILMWQAHGFDQDVWDCGVQFRENHKRFRIPEDSGFEVVYPFEIDGNALEAIRRHPFEVALERPELYAVAVNGKTVDTSQGRRWLDETIRAFECGALLQPGRNELSLKASPWRRFCEITYAYVLGQFASTPAGKGFVLEAPKPLSVGDWTSQGLTHYSGSVRYTAKIELERPVEKLTIEVTNWLGSHVKVYLDDSQLGALALRPSVLTVESPIMDGQYDLTVEVVGTAKNLLGPHHAPGAPPGPGAWRLHPPHQPPGASYEILPYGLMGPVKVTY